MPSDSSAKSAWAAEVIGDVLAIHLHRDFDASGKDHDWAQLIVSRWPGPFARVDVDLSKLGTRVNSTFFAGLYRLHGHYAKTGDKTITLIGPDERAIQCLDILSMRPLFRVAPKPGN
ncbi:MAG: hypothetical protein H0W72_15770 [Planctomycetes bacterium]|nr:hypothetical protein [Planctomycetota bacterium]